MNRGSAPPVATDGNGGKKISMTVSITDLIMDLRTAFRGVDYDRVEEVLVEKENKLKAGIKELTEKLELQTLLRMHAEEECKERYERLLESSKKNNELDRENIAELRIRIIKLEDEKRKAELVAESWKRKFEELSERVLMVEKGVNSFMNGDTHVGNGGKPEEPSSIQGTTDPGVSDKVMGEKDTSVVDIRDNERGNTTAGSSPLQRNDLKSGNTPASAAEVTMQSLDSPNKALLGSSGVSTEEMEKKENNEVDIDDHESPSQGKTDDCRNAHLTVDNDARQSLEAPDTSPSPDVAVPGAPDNCRNAHIAINDDAMQSLGTSPSPNLAMPSASNDCGNAHLAIDDDARQSLGNPDTSPSLDLAMLGALGDCGNAHLVVDDEAMQSLDALGTSPSPDLAVLGASNDCGNARLTIDDDVRQSLDVPDTSPSPDVALPGASDHCGNAHHTVIDDAGQSPDAPDNSPSLDLALLGASGSQKEVIEIKDSDDDDDDDGDDECIASGALNGKEASFSGLLDSLKRKWFPEAGDSFDGLNKNPLDGSHTDDDSSSSSTSSLQSRINEVHLPPNFLCSIGSKRRKT